MKIAFIGQKGIPTKFGGIERHVEELAVRLVKAGQKVFVYCRPWYAPVDKKSFRGIKLISLPSIRTKHLDAISHTFIATLHALFSDYDIIHYHGVGPALLSFIPRIFKPQVRVVATFHCIDRKHQKWGLFARTFLKLGERAACLFAHQTITVSKTLQYYCSQIYNTDTVYIPNGVGRKNVNCGSDLIAKKFGLQENGYLLVVSRLVRHKGIHYLINAFHRLKTDKKLVIVGDSAFTDDYVQELHDLSYGSKNIIFTGYQNGKVLDQLFANAYAFILPSESEGLPIVILEAMAYGKAVLASDITENLEVVRGHGFSFRNKQIDDLVSRLKHLLDNQKNVEAIGRESRDFVMQNYNWDDIVKKTIVLYHQTLKSGAKKGLAPSQVQA
ncbi:MAG: glycosyltransferase family 4 protein [Patescibacteria group bacterium]|jgi:glycosyltransferase involved in cell wall biosynthesis